MWYGLPAYLQRHLQSVLNAAARLVFRLCCYDPVADAVATVHWLRLPERVDFDVAATAFRVLHGLAPSYVDQLYLPGRHHLHSYIPTAARSGILLAVARFRLLHPSFGTR